MSMWSIAPTLDREGERGDRVARHFPRRHNAVGHVASPPARSPISLEELLYKPVNSLVMHNGAIGDFPTVKRDPTLAVEPTLFPEVEGSTDSELFFFLALTFGLEEDPLGAVARAVGLIEATGQRHGIQYPIQMTVATTDGETTWAFRYSSEGRSRSLFHSTDVTTLRLQYPENPVLHGLSDDARLVVSEPLGDLRGAWREVPESTCLVVQGGREELREFSPLAQATG